MAEHIDAGKLDRPAQVLELRETGDGVWTWEPIRRAWANITFQPKSNLFSQVGVGARDAAVVIRRQPLTLHNALRLGEQHLFLTSITDRGRGHLDVDAAVVAVDSVRLRPDQTTKEMTFPGILTEKYVRHEQEWPMSVNELGLVLVTPKAITLCPGCLVETRGAAWEVLVPHELDQFKNEYEIGRRVDL